MSAKQPTMPFLSHAHINSVKSYLAYQLLGQHFPYQSREHQHGLSTYRRGEVHHSQETRGTHKTDPKQGGTKGGERKRFNTQDTKHSTKRGSQHHRHSDEVDEK